MAKNLKGFAKRSLFFVKKILLFCYIQRWRFITYKKTNIEAGIIQMQGTKEAKSMFKVDEQILNDVKDSLAGGFANGELIIMGVSPSIEKTTFVCSLIDDICIKDRKKCVFLTSEMSVRKTVERLIEIHGNVKCDENGGDDYWERIIEAVADIGKAPLYIYDIDADRGFIEKCREISKSGKIDVIIIDYLQLPAVNSEAVNATQVSLKQLALELKCPVFAI